MSTASISRRRFAQILSVGAAYAASNPALAFGRERATSVTVSGIIRLSSNENPYGPSSKALKAITNAFELACRYPDEHSDLLIEALAKQDGVGSDQILLGAGSGEILRMCATAFTGREEGTLVVADPTFEAIVGHAKRRGAEIVQVPLTSSFSHDLPKMTAAAQAGLVYVCNPNNPTASLTSKDEVRSFLGENGPTTAILVDEAYHHYVDSSDYESVIPLLKDYPNLIVARTFSKIYGMAGMRCGYCVAQPATIERLRPHQLSDSVNIMALVAASASLQDPDQVANGRRLNSEARSFVSKELEIMGYQQIPSQANFIMFDTKRPVVPLIKAMKQRKVHVGRLFPALPNHLRLTIGKKAEMESFLVAFRAVVADRTIS